MKVLNVIMGCFFPFIIGVLIRYASRKWDRPLLVTVCLIFAVIVGSLVTSVKSRIFLETFKIRVAIFAFMILGALIADLIYRIRSKQ